MKNKKLIMGLLIVLGISLSASAKEKKNEKRTPDQVVTDFGGKEDGKYSANYTMKCSGLNLVETKEKSYQDLSSQKIDIPEYEKDSTSAVNIMNTINYKFSVSRYKNQLILSLLKNKSGNIGTLISSSTYELKDKVMVDVYYTTDDGAVSATALNCLVKVKK